MPADERNNVLSLTSPSDLRVLPVVRALVQVAGQLAGLSEQRSYEAVVAINEACSNVIHHAHHDDRDFPLTVACRVVDDGLEITLCDQGSPFDFEAVPDLDPTEIRAGGRGVYLIRRLMDKVTSTRLEQGGNELRMFKRTAAPTAAG
ncbi:MAG: ATP-binding protein [Pirellulales bacterium]